MLKLWDNDLLFSQLLRFTEPFDFKIIYLLVYTASFLHLSLIGCGGLSHDWVLFADYWDVWCWLLSTEL